MNRSATLLLCPICGYAGSHESTHGGTFRLLYDVIYHRDLEVNGTRLIPSGPEGRYDECEGHQRLECRDCLHEFPLAPEYEVDWLAGVKTLSS